MQIEKKLILCSILAVAIGVAAIVPLAFVMTPAKGQTTTTDSQAQFTIDVPYAYVTDYWNDTTEANNTYGYVYAIALHGTPNFDVENTNVSAIYEYYNVEVASEKGSIANMSYYTYATMKPYKPFNFSFGYENQWFNTSQIGCSSGMAGYDNGTSMGIVAGTADSWNWNTAEPTNLTVTVQRLGSIILNADNSTSIYMANNDAVAVVQLDKYNAGFMYNTLFSKDELAQLNPLYPMIKISQLS